MANYIDGFVFPIPKSHLDSYQKIASQVASIWKEYGALAYNEFVGDDMSLEGCKSFTSTMDIKEHEAVIFGWVVFPSKELRDIANAKVPLDPRMEELVAPLVDPNHMVFDASRMVYGGFKTLVESEDE